MIAMNPTRSLLLLLVSVAACGTPPPRPWLRFQQDGRTNWNNQDGTNYTARLHGADLRLDLGRRQTRIELLVENSSAAPVEVRIGAEASQREMAVGEVLLRPLTGVGGPPTKPYATMQPMIVEAGWRGTFFLDSPLGRDPIVGQFFVLTTEVRNQAGEVERRSLPLVATNAGTMPADGS
jgi:hypothetical protein